MRPHRRHTRAIQSYWPGFANFHPHLIRGSTGSPESTSKMASRRVQLFLHSSRQRIPILNNGPSVFPLQNCRFAWHMIVTDQQTHHSTPSVTIGYIYVVLRCGLIIMSPIWIHRNRKKRSNIPSANVSDWVLARGPHVPSKNRARMWNRYGVFGTRLLMTADWTPFETFRSALASVNDRTTPASSR